MLSAFVDSPIIRDSGRSPFDFSPYDVLGPEIRHALQYEGAMLTPEHIATLVRKGGIDAGIYLTAKALNGDKEKQEGLLKKLLASIEQQPGKPLAHSGILFDVLSDLSPSATVKGEKIAQLSRQGFETWEVRNRQLAQKLAMGKQTPALVAYASLLGFRHVAEETDGNPFLILAPSWIEDANDPLCGYEIYKKPNETGERVAFLPKDFYRPENIVIVDDAIKTGKHLDMIQDFLSSGHNGRNNYSAIFTDRIAPPIAA